MLDLAIAKQQTKVDIREKLNLKMKAVDQVHRQKKILGIFQKGVSNEIEG